MRRPPLFCEDVRNREEGWKSRFTIEAVDSPRKDKVVVDSQEQHLPASIGRSFRQLCINRENGQSRKKDSFFSPMFGVSLSLLTRSDGGKAAVPYVITRLCSFIEEQEFLGEICLFVGEADAKRVEQLRKDFDHKGDVNFHGSVDLSAAACLLKVFLQQLPQPVVPSWMNVSFIAAWQDLRGDEVMYFRKLHSLLDSLPDVNYSVLRYLCGFLNRLYRRKIPGKSSASSLGSAFGSNLFRVSKNVEANSEMKVINCIMVHLIVFYDKSFCYRSRNEVGRGIPYAAACHNSALPLSCSSSSSRPSRNGDASSMAGPALPSAEDNPKTGSSQKRRHEDDKTKCNQHDASCLSAQAALDPVKRYWTMSKVNSDSSCSVQLDPEEDYPERWKYSPRFESYPRTRKSRPLHKSSSYFLDGRKEIFEPEICNSKISVEASSDLPDSSEASFDFVCEEEPVVSRRSPCFTEDYNEMPMAWQEQYASPKFRQELSLGEKEKFKDGHVAYLGKSTGGLKCFFDGLGRRKTQSKKFADYPHDRMTESNGKIRAFLSEDSNVGRCQERSDYDPYGGFASDYLRSILLQEIRSTLGKFEENLRKERSKDGRPEKISDMTLNDLLKEKVAIQKALLNFEDLYGRPTHKDVRYLVRPLYMHYRNIKRTLSKMMMSQSKEELVPILEHEAMDFTSPSPRRTPDARSPSPSNHDIIQYVQMLPSKNLHSLPLHELLAEHSALKKEKRHLRHRLKEFEVYKEGGRMDKSDYRSEFEDATNAYKVVKGHIKLLEALIEKQERP